MFRAYTLGMIFACEVAESSQKTSAYNKILSSF